MGMGKRAPGERAPGRVEGPRAPPTRSPRRSPAGRAEDEPDAPARAPRRFEDAPPRAPRLSDVAPARAAWGEAAPFEGLVPGLSGAGALAAELERVVRGRALAEGASEASREERARWIDEALTPAAIACRAALPAPDRVAFDAATLIVAELHAPEAVAPRVAALARRWDPAPPALRAIAAVALMLGAGEALVTAARAAAERSRGSPRDAARRRSAATLTALCEAAVAAGDVATGQAVLLAGSSQLDDAERARLHALLRAAARSGPPAALQKLRPSAVTDALDRRLAPDFSLLDALTDAAADPPSGRAPR